MKLASSRRRKREGLEPGAVEAWRKLHIRERHVGVPSYSERLGMSQHSHCSSSHMSEQFQRLMADHGVVCAVSPSGRLKEDAVMDSFFSSLQTERTAHKTATGDSSRVQAPTVK